MHYYFSRVIKPILICGSVLMTFQVLAVASPKRLNSRAAELIRLTGYVRPELAKSRALSVKRELPSVVTSNGKHYRIEMFEKGYFQWSEKGVPSGEQGYGRYECCDSLEMTEISAFSNFLNCSMMISDIALSIKITYCNDSEIRITMGDRIAVIRGNEYVFVDGTENMANLALSLLNSD